MSRRRTLSRRPCPACGREVSYSYGDPVAGPLVWRRHNDPRTGRRCVDELGRDQRRPLSWEREQQ